MMEWDGIIKSYRKYMPKIDDENIITLKEGNTPLIEATNLEKIFRGLRYT